MNLRPSGSEPDSIAGNGDRLRLEVRLAVLNVGAESRISNVRRRLCTRVGSAAGGRLDCDDALPRDAPPARAVQGAGVVP